MFDGTCSCNESPKFEREYQEVEGGDVTGIKIP